MSWLKKLFGKKDASTVVSLVEDSQESFDKIMKIHNEMMKKENEKILAQSDAIINQLNNLTPEEQVHWVEWYGALSNEQKKLVDMLRRDAGIVVREENFEELWRKIQRARRKNPDDYA